MSRPGDEEPQTPAAPDRDRIVSERHDARKSTREALERASAEPASVERRLRDRIEELEGAASEMTNLLASSEIITLLLGNERRIKRFTPAAAQLFNLTGSDIGRPIEDITAGFADARLGADIEHTLKTLVPTQQEVVTAGGHWFRRRITPYCTGDRHVEGAVLTFFDVHALKQAEQSLLQATRELEQRAAERTATLEREVAERARAQDAVGYERDLLETLLDVVPATVLVSDTEGHILRFNRAAQETSGLSLEEVKGKAVFDQVLPPEDLASALELFERVTRGDFPQAAQTQWVNRDGTRRQLAWKATGLLDDEGKVRYVIGAAMDLTDRIHAEEMIKVRQDELAALHRVHIANELAATLAHELNQPLAAIATYGETGLRLLAAPGPEAPDRTRDVLRKITEQAKRAGDSIRALRRLVSAAPSQSRSCDIRQLIASACSLVQPAIRQQRIRLEVTLPSGLPSVMANPVHVEHVLTNLMRNAIESIRDSGLAQGLVKIRGRRVENAVQVSVEDSGPGIGADQAESMFEPFYTTKEGSLGMGLRISRRLVEEGGGRLWVEPHRPGGRLHFTLPLAK